jgi:predicted RNA-binding protein YlxR (DUF448 family)
MKTKTSAKPGLTGTKHAPQRTCVACRQVKNKREMVRLVRLPEGGVIVDRTGKRNGRGAYICPTRNCWDKALAEKQLERTLKTTISEENLRELGLTGQSLIKGDN